MKLLDFNNFEPLNSLLKKMNISPDSTPSFVPPTVFLKEDLRLKETGVEVDPTEIKQGAGGTITYNGKRVIVYIRDQYSRYESSHKFHISWCKTLESKRKEGTYRSKYVVSLRKDGAFLVNIINNNNSFEQKYMELKVCKNCLKNLNYKNYNDCNNETKEEIYNNFSLDEFFAMNFSKKKIYDIPNETEITAPINKYTSNWSAISKSEKQQQSNTCEECGKVMSNNMKELHVHHIDGNKSNNSKSNLKVLCFDCHKKIHPHLQKL